MDRTSSPSTPRHGHNSSFISPTSKNRGVVTPMRLGIRRYSLAETLPTPSFAKQKGPADTFLSTKIDSNSPGFSSRIIQYNDEQEKSLSSSPRHHSKYDKLGVFPIVHFFKKDLPHLKRKADDTSSHLNSSDLSKYNSPEHNRMLLEKIIKTSPGNQDLSSSSEVSGKSVLDALKEISRKRIHPNNEEFILNEDGKRMYVDSENDNARKRQRQNSLLEDHSITTLPNKITLMDEVMASHSSMEGYFMTEPKEVQIEKSPKPRKPTTVAVKCVDVETQTIAPPPAVTPQVPVPESSKEEDNIKKYTKVKRTSPIKVFDETPLEAMRKNRLTALMGTMTPKKKPSDTMKASDSTVDKPLVSILSANSKSPHKGNKHVTFDIPEPGKSSGENNLPIPSSTITFNSEPPGITKTSSAVVHPIVSASIVESASPQKTVGSTTSSGMSFLSKDDTNNSLPPGPSSNPPQFMFGDKAISPILPVSSSNVINSTSTFKKDDVNIPKENPQQLVVSKTDKPTGVVNVDLKGGFKFELKSPSTTTVTKPSAPFSFMGLTTVANASTSLPSQTTSSSVTGALPNLLQLPIQNTPITSNTTNNLSSISSPSQMFGQGNMTFQQTNAKNFHMNSSTPFSVSKNPLGALETTSSATSSRNATVSLSNTTSSASNPTFTPSFGKNVATSNFMSGPSSTKASTVAPMFGLGTSSSSATNTVNPSVRSHSSTMFGFPSTNTSTTSMPFGTRSNVSTVSSSFNAATNPSTVISPFNPATNPSTVISPFNAATNPSTVISPFNVATNVSAVSSPFNVATNVSAVSSPFNAPTNFSTVASPFNAATLTVTTVTSPFNGANTFVTSTAPTTNAFSATQTKTTAANAFFFGTTNTFNQPKPSSTSNFGVDSTTKPTFGQNVVPSFNTTTVASFGNNNNALTSTTSPFGSATPVTTQSSGFGGTFGTSTETTPFGGQTNTNFGGTSFGFNQKPGFGSNTATDNKNSFTAPFAFGATTTASDFNTNVNTFNTTSSSFGSTQPFGQTSSNSTLPSGFDKPIAAANPFGNTSTSSFGSGGFSTNPQSSQANVFSFGNNTPAKPSVFSFGSNETPKPFNFQPENTANAFGSPNSGFNANSTPAAFNNPMSTPQFNVSGVPGMFNIGTGGSSTPNRSRTQHKARRRV